MTTCDITFDNNQLKVYSTGKLVRGNIRLTLQEEKKVRGAYVRIYGRAYAEVRNGKSYYKGKENYLDQKTYFVGGPNGKIIHFFRVNSWQNVLRDSVLSIDS